MPIALAISGIVIPGLAFTSSSVCSARVPDPRGRPRRPPRGRGRARARRARRRAPGGAGRAADARGRAAPGQARERGGRGLELAVLLDERLELAQPSGDLFALLLQEVTHRYSSQSCRGRRGSATGAGQDNDR